MKAGYTDIVIILDESGSMETLKESTLAGVNKFIKEQKKLEGKCTVSLTTFSSVAKHQYIRIPVKAVKKLTDTAYTPYGNTALYDAIGACMDMAGRTYASMIEASRPEKVLFIIVTDGMENASRKYSQSQIAEMIKHQQEKYNWQFMYMGANQDAILAAKEISIPSVHTMNYSNSVVGTEHAYDTMVCSANALRSYAGTPTMDCFNLTVDNQKQVDLIKSLGK